MSEFPKLFTFPDPLVVISSFGQQSVGSCFFNNSGPGSNTYPSANLAIYVPFRLTRPFIATAIILFNGGTASGNIDLGIYGKDGVKLVSTGSVAQSGTSQIQSVSITPTELGVGLFYMAVAMDNATGTIYRVGVNGPVPSILGMAEQASAFTLPASATFATSTQGVIPMMGITGRSVI